ncbi:hypothetical protein [Pseudomonas sp. UMAB-40]|uniref:hypothetical protein n=1 Tax=Pseudomonas sp. UMAB-40 TaxID=1365407 RepID=UPI001C59F526|nr:hypothetical protein [Pseudomonas sp. UMAB-40]
MRIQNIAEAGSLDGVFGDGGIVSINIPGALLVRIESIHSVGAGPDRKIYFAGMYFGAPEGQFYFLGRLNSDGSFDNTFGDAGNNGVITGSFQGHESTITSLVILSDGKILVYGYASSSEFLNAPALARFETNGTLDRSFGDDGTCVHDIDLQPPANAVYPDEPQSNDNSNSSPYGVEILPDGKILISKHYAFGFGPSMGLIVRLCENGSLDLTFNQIGYITVIHPQYLLTNTQLMNIMVQPDGMYLGCGAVWDRDKPHCAMFVRFDNEGKLDKSFGDGGFALQAPRDGDGLRVALMALQSDNRILGIGNTVKTDMRAMLMSIKPDGTPDTRFNGGLPLYTSIEESLTAWTGGAIQTDGKIVVVGAAASAKYEFDIVVARFNDKGFDPAFGGKGWVRTHVGEGAQEATGMTLQDDGKIVVSAFTQRPEALILRYNA